MNAVEKQNEARKKKRKKKKKGERMGPSDRAARMWLGLDRGREVLRERKGGREKGEDEEVLVHNGRRCSGIRREKQHGIGSGFVDPV